MSISARVASFASLAFAVWQLALPGGASAPEGGFCVVVEAPEQFQRGAHPPTYTARTCLPDRAADRLLETPLAPAQRITLGSSPAGVAAPAVGSSGAGANALVLLPPTRAPPALS